jgi:hypothetical protein
MISGEDSGEVEIVALLLGVVVLDVLGVARKEVLMSCWLASGSGRRMEREREEVGVVEPERLPAAVGTEGSVGVDWVETLSGVFGVEVFLDFLPEVGVFLGRGMAVRRRR